VKHIWIAVLTLALAGCDNSSLLTSVQGEVTRYNEAKVPPTITPPGGTYRNSSNVPMVTLSTPVAGARLIYTLDGSTPVFNSLGSVQYPTTQRVDVPSTSWASGTFATGMGVFPLRAVGWRDGVASGEATAYFRVPGPGGTVWSKTGLGASEGQVLAMARYETSGGRLNLGGWVKDWLGRRSGVLVQTDDNGTILWSLPVQAQSGSLAATSEITGAATDSSGNIYIVGNVHGAGDYRIDGSSFSVGGPSGFLAAITPSGTCTWSVPIQSSVEVHLSGVAVAGATVYVSGWAEGSDVEVYCSVVPLGSVGFSLMHKYPVLGVHSHGFLVRYLTSGGTPSLWTGGEAGEVDRYYGVAASTNVVALVGAFLTESPSGTTFNFGGSVVSKVPGAWQALMVTFLPESTAANHTATLTGATDDTVFKAVAVNSSGSIAVAAQQQGSGTVTWGGQTWSGASSGSNGLVVCYDSSATTSWVAGVLSSEGSSVNGVGFTPSGSYLYAVGRIGIGTSEWASATEVAAATPATVFPSTGAPSSRSPLVVQVNPVDGSALWVRSTGSSSSDAEVYAIAPAASVGLSAFAAGTAPGKGPLVWDEALKVAGPGSGDNPLLYEVYE